MNRNDYRPRRAERKSTVIRYGQSLLSCSFWPHWPLVFQG